MTEDDKWEIHQHLQAQTQGKTLEEFEEFVYWVAKSPSLSMLEKQVSIDCLKDIWAVKQFVARIEKQDELMALGLAPERVDRAKNILDLIRARQARNKDLEDDEDLPGF